MTLQNDIAMAEAKLAALNGSAEAIGRRIMAGEASTKDIALYEHDAAEAQALAMRLHKMKLRNWLEDSK